jgi:tubby-related protein 1
MDFLMAAKKKAAKATPYLLVSMERQPEDRGSNKVLGKVRGNTVGSQYSIVDSGMAPGKTHAPSTIRRELGTVKFEYLNSSPSHMECYLPAVARQPNPQPGVLSGADRAYSPELKGGSGPGHGYVHDDGCTEMAAAVADKNFKNMCRLENIKAKWDDVHGGHVLNFNGRVTESSVKNFQLKVVGRYGSNTVANQCVEDETVVLQFGRVGKNEFTMDVRWPLSPFQAFSICAACIDDKIADRRGYAIVKKWTGIG